MSGLQPKTKYSLANLFSPQSALEFVGFALICVATNLLSNLLAPWSPLGLVGVVFLFLYWFWIEQRRAKRLSKARFQVTPEAPKAARGIILLLSPYSPRNPALKDAKTLRDLIDNLLTAPVENLTKKDFVAIDLFNSNLVPQIKAIEYHVKQGKLQDAWLITSKTHDKVKGSEQTAAILEKYLRFEYGVRLEIHFQDLCVEDFNYQQLSKIGEQIFQECDYKDEVIVADITGGTKMMSVALAMACIQPGRRMQYMGSERDWQGNPLHAGELKPIGIDVAPIIYG